jgi:hypothetical protein
MKRATYDPELIKTQIENNQRGPFRELLARFLMAAPTDDAIHDEGQKYPNRWVQNIQMLAKSAGYKDGVEVEVNLNQWIASASDAELAQKLKESQQLLLDSESNDTG